MEKVCKQCKKSYTSRGKYFCGHSCRATYTNLHNNPQRLPEVRNKISKIAKQTHRQKQLMTKEARQKAIPKIAAAHRGRNLTSQWKKNIGIGVKRAGCIPPRNSHLVGNKHPNWQGGFTTIRNKEFQKQEYIDFRNKVLKRDNYTCQACQQHGGKLNVHHIEPWGPNPDLRYVISNGITLCKKCHYTKHKNTPRPLTVGPRTLADLELNQLAIS
jgi:5-methylcytosine-specific restriction endonuclease McrA